MSVAVIFKISSGSSVFYLLEVVHETGIIWPSKQMQNKTISLAIIGPQLVDCLGVI